MKRSLIIFLALIILQAISIAQARLPDGQEKPTLTSIEVSSYKGYDEVIIQTSAEFINPKVSRLEMPPRLLIEIPDISAKTWEVTVLSSRIKDIRTYEEGEIARIVIDLKKYVDYEVANIYGRGRLLLEITDEKATGEGRVEIKEKKEIEIPNLAEVKNFKLVIKGKDFSLGKQPIFVDHTLMIKASDFFSLLDCRVAFNPEIERYLVKYRDVNLVLDIGQRRAITGKGVETLSVSPILLKKVAYIPLIQVSAFLGLYPMWEETSKTLFINPKIVRIVASEDAHEGRVKITSTDTIDRKKVKSSEEVSSIIVDIKDALLDTPVIENPGLALISSIEGIQFDNRTTRLKIYLKYPLSLKIEEKSKIEFDLILTPKTKPKIEEIKKEKIVLKKRIVIIDPGHGGRDPGAIGKYISEKKFAFALALKLRALLKKIGFTAILTREKDEFKSYKKIVEFVNRRKADIFISIHCNASAFKGVGGIETYYFKKQDRFLAKTVHNALVRGIRLRGRGIKKVSYYTIHHIMVPAILVEPFYITNRREEKLALNPAFQWEIANDILIGIKEYFVKKK